MRDTCHSAKQTDPHIYTDTVFHSKNTLKKQRRSGIINRVYISSSYIYIYIYLNIYNHIYI